MNITHRIYLGWIDKRFVILGIWQDVNSALWGDSCDPSLKLGPRSPFVILALGKDITSPHLFDSSKNYADSSSFQVHLNLMCQHKKVPSAFTCAAFEYTLGMRMGWSIPDGD